MSLRHAVRVSPLALAIALGGPIAAQAQQTSAPAPARSAAAPNAPPSQEQTPADVSFSVGELVVTAIPYGSSAQTLFTSVDRLGADVIARQNVDNAWELFGRLPGVLLTDFNQGTTSGRFSIRGFNGEGEINAVKLLIDGVPSNTNDGAVAFIDGVFPLEISAAETVRGTLDPRFGLNNIAGNASLITRQGGDYAQARLSYGGWNAQDAQLVLGHEIGAFTQNYFFGHRRADGYRDHANTSRTAVSGKWGFAAPKADARFGLSARYYRAKAREPGYLTLADASATPQRSYAVSASDGGDRTIRQVSAGYDGSPGEGLSADAKIYFNRFDDDRFVRFSAAVDQQERVAHERQTGVLANLRYDAPSGPLHALALAAGVDAQFQDVRSLRYLTKDRARMRQTRDQAFSLDTQGGYLKIDIEPTQALKLIPAYRVDRVSGHYNDRLTGAAAGVNDYGLIGQPKFSAIWTPRPDLMVYGNYGRTFQIGAGSGAYKIPPRQRDLAPSINDGWELGAKVSRGDRLEGRIAVWQQTASGEVKRKLNDPTGDSENLGRTRRRGLDVQLSMTLSKTVSGWAALTLQQAKILEPDPSTPAARGKSIDHVPQRLLSAGLDYELSDRLALSGSITAQSAYYLEQTNRTGRFGAYALASLEATYQLTGNLDLQLQVKNITNARTEYVWWDGAQSLHSPGDARAAYAAVLVRF